MIPQGSVEHVTTRSAEETMAVGERVASGCPIRAGLQIGLSGVLGSGKTIMSKGLLRGFGLKLDVVVQSPTYMIYKKYEGLLPLYHFDFYRLSSARDLDSIDFWEAREEGICLIEWYDRFKDVLPRCDYEIELGYGETANERNITVRKNP